MTKRDEGSGVDDSRLTVLIVVACDDTAGALAQTFDTASWRVLHGSTAGTWPASATNSDAVDCLIFDPGFVCYDPTHGEHTVDRAAGVLADLVASAEPVLRSRADGGASVVALSSRDALGSASHVSRSAEAAGIIAAGRSLALLYAPHGVSVNVVCAPGAGRPDDDRAAQALLPEPVSLAAVIDAAAFFADPRSRYITGQTLHVSGGASLLSSFSA